MAKGGVKAVGYCVRFPAMNVLHDEILATNDIIWESVNMFLPLLKYMAGISRAHRYAWDKSSQV